MLKLRNIIHLKPQVKKSITLNPKIKSEIDFMVSVDTFKELIGHEILYQVAGSDEPKYTYWSKVIGLSNNNRYVKLVDLDVYDDTVAYYRDISVIELVDQLN